MAFSCPGDDIRFSLGIVKEAMLITPIRESSERNYSKQPMDGFILFS